MSARLNDLESGPETDFKNSHTIDQASSASTAHADGEKARESAVPVIDDFTVSLEDTYIGKSIGELEDAIAADAPVTISQTNAYAWTLRVVASLVQVTVFLAIFTFLYAGAVWTQRTQNIIFGVAVAPQLDYSVFPEAAVAKLPSPQELVDTTFVQAFQAFTKDRFTFQLMDDITDRDTLLTTVDDGARVWSAFFIPSDYSRTLVAGILGVNGTPPSTVEYIHDQGRGYNIDTLFVNALIQFQTSYRSTLAQSLLKIAGAAGPANMTTFWVDGPVQMTLTNIHPVTKQSQDTIITISIILITITSMLSANFISKIRVPSDRIRQGILRLVWGIPFELAISFVIAGVPFVVGGGSAQGDFGRVWFWWFFVGCTSLAYVSMVFNLLGNKMGQGIVMMSVYLFITSAGGIAEMLVTPDFYRIGYALFPYYAVHGCRAIMFESQTHLLYRDALVMLAWFVFCVSVKMVAYVRGVNERVGHKMNAVAKRKIEVPARRGKPGLGFLKRGVAVQDGDVAV